jgi:hypothetical protein
MTDYNVNPGKLILRCGGDNPSVVGKDSHLGYDWALVYFGEWHVIVWRLL